MLAFIGLGFLAAGGASAKIRDCETNLAGQVMTLQFDTESVEYRSLRENWSPFAPKCPSEAVIARLLPDTKPEDRRAYCLLSNKKTGAYLAAVVGRGDRFGRCKEEGLVCRAVNGAKDYTKGKAVDAKETILGSRASLTATGVDLVTRGSGAMVLSGTSGNIAGILNAGATSAVEIASAPAVLGGVAAGAVVIGGALLICRE